MIVQRAFPTILSDRLPETRDFYVALLGFGVAFDSDWFVGLSTATSGALSSTFEPGEVPEVAFEVGIWRVDHDLVPASHRAEPAGVMLTFVVDDVDAVHALARRARMPVVAPPRDLFFGRRQMLVCDPNGVLVDVSSPSAPSPAFRSELAQRGLVPDLP